MDYKSLECLKLWPMDSDLIISALANGCTQAEIAFEYGISDKAINRKICWIKRSFEVADPWFRISDHPDIILAASYWDWLLQHPSGERVILYYWMRCAYSSTLVAKRYFYTGGTVRAVIRNGYRRRGLTRLELRGMLERWKMDRRNARSL